MTSVTGVWLFFAISGYVISKPFVDRLLERRPPPDIRSYAVRRGMRIYPLYWIGLTIVILVTGAAHAQSWQYLLHYALLQNLAPGRQEAILPVAWTLTVEVLFYVSLPILSVLIRRTTRRLTPQHLAFCVLGSWALSIVFSIGADFLNASHASVSLYLRQLFPSMWQMFCPGILVAIVPHFAAGQTRAPKPRWLTSGTAVAGALTLFIVATGLNAVGLTGVGTTGFLLLLDLQRIVFALAYGLLLAAALLARPWEGGLSSLGLRLGTISYGIYLIHGSFVQMTLNPSVERLIPLRTGSPEAFIVHLLLLLAFTIPFAALSWRWLEEPCIALSRRWSARFTADVSTAPVHLTPIAVPARPVEVGAEGADLAAGPNHDR